MTADIDHIVEDLNKLITELETVMANAKGASGERLSDHLETAAAGLRTLVDAVQHRIDDLQGKLERRISRTAKTAKKIVRENPWGILAIGAGIALLLGFALSRSTSGCERESASEHSQHDR